MLADIFVSSVQGGFLADKYRFRVDRRKHRGFETDLCGHQPRPQGFSLKKMGGERGYVDMALLAIFVAMYNGTVWDGITSFIGELYQRRRRRQPGRQKSNRFITQNNNFARASRFFVHFFTVLARLRRENA